MCDACTAVEIYVFTAWGVLARGWQTIAAAEDVNAGA
jgi:hypothetical protein